MAALDVEVVVIGGGLAGLSAALVLGARLAASQPTAPARVFAEPSTVEEAAGWLVQTVEELKPG